MIKKILEEDKKKRQKFISAGSNKLIVKIDDNDFINSESVDRLKLVIKSIANIDLDNKVITLKNKGSDNLPIFKAGSTITITMNIDRKYVSNTYYLINSRIDNEYQILVRDSDNLVDKQLFLYSKVGNVLTSSKPESCFTYNSIRDGKLIIGIAENLGIAPMLSYANELLDSVEDYALILFYYGKNAKDLIFKRELDDIASKTSRFKVIYVLQKSSEDYALNGYVSLDKIKPYINSNTSIFISGNEGLYKYLDKELEPLKFPKRFVRYAPYLPNCNIRKVSEYKLTIVINNEIYQVKCYNNKTIMNTLIKEGFYIPSQCGIGECGFCRSELVLGKVKIVNDKRLKADIDYNFIHPCCTYPMSDIKIIIR